MLLRDTIDELDGLVAELSRLRQALCRAELAEIRPSDDASTAPSTSPSPSTLPAPGADTADNALWDVEAGLRRVATRAEARAHTVRRAIELRLAEETRRDDPDGRRTA